jgi:hypothetical protein
VQGTSRPDSSPKRDGPLLATSSRSFPASKSSNPHSVNKGVEESSLRLPYQYNCTPGCLQLRVPRCCNSCILSHRCCCTLGRVTTQTLGPSRTDSKHCRCRPHPFLPTTRFHLVSRLLDHPSTNSTSPLRFLTAKFLSTCIPVTTLLRCHHRPAVLAHDLFEL